MPTKAKKKLGSADQTALELLAVRPQPVDTADPFIGIYKRLIKAEFAIEKNNFYEITEAGCDYLSRYVATSSFPNHDAPCGFVRLN